MNRVQALCVAGSLVAAWLLGASEAQAQSCKRTCDEGETRDAKGCCRETEASRAKKAEKVAAEAARRAAAARASAGRESSSGSGGSSGRSMAVIPGGGGVDTFSIDVTEVTVAAYAACVRAGSCSESGLNQPFWGGEKKRGAQWCNWGKDGKGNHPVNCVDWNQARAYCSWAGKRLPTEQEWQRAAESAEGRTYPWGEAAPSNQLCWDGEGNSLGKGNRQSTCAVGSFPAGHSAQGVKDLSGNALEWTDSCSDSSCSARVGRGGGWFYDDPSYVRAAFRDRNDPSNRNYYIGFRCSRSN